MFSSKKGLMESPACRYKHKISSCADFLVVLTLNVYFAYSAIYFKLQLAIETN